MKYNDLRCAQVWDLDLNEFAKYCHENYAALNDTPEHAAQFISDILMTLNHQAPMLPIFIGKNVSKEDFFMRNFQQYCSDTLILERVSKELHDLSKSQQQKAAAPPAAASSRFFIPAVTESAENQSLKSIMYKGQRLDSCNKDTFIEYCAMNADAIVQNHSSRSDCVFISQRIKEFAKAALAESGKATPERNGTTLGREFGAEFWSTIAKNATVDVADFHAALEAAAWITDMFAQDPQASSSLNPGGGLGNS